MFKYQLGPIDYFDGCISLPTYLVQQEGEASHVLATLARGMAEMLSESCWEGDISQGIFVFALPTDEIQTEVGFIWKQSNNGTTFILSPCELLWLRSHMVLK